MTRKHFYDKEFYSKLFRITMPIAFQSLMLAAVAAGDSIMLGLVEQNSMSAVSLATQIQFVQNMMLSSVVSAATVLGAQYWGKGDKKTVNEIFGLILKVAGFISVLFFLACEFFPEVLMLLFTNEQVLIDIGADYLRIAGWSYLLTGVSQCYLGIMKVSEHVKPSAMISTCAVLLNIVLNAVFIFGLFGLPEMGANGAALATTVSRCAELTAVIVLSFRKTYLRPAVRYILHTGRILFRDYLKYFFPLLGASLLWGVGFTSYTAVMGHMGVDATAGNAVAAVVRDLMCCMCNGMANAANIIVGNELGNGNLTRGKLYGDRVSTLSFLIGFATCAIIMAATPLIVKLVVLTDQARKYLFGMMFIMAVYMIARCINTVMINGVLAAGGDTFYDMYSLVVSMWCIAVPLSFLGAFVFNWPVFVVYICTCVDEVGKIPWLIIHYRKYKWVRDLTRDDID